MPKVTMMASVSNGFQRSKNSIALKKFLEFSRKCSGKHAGAKKVRYNGQCRKMIPMVKN
jgi:hypothetical protein